MENASKALIIAGAILLSILIVSLGIMVYQGAKETVGSSNLNKQEIESFNSQWESYEGNKQTASQVRAMVQAVIANNASESQSGTNRWIAVTNTGTASTAVLTTAPTGITVPSYGNAAGNVANSKTYTIKCGYGSTNGLIVCIDWKENP